MLHGVIRLFFGLVRFLENAVRLLPHEEKEDLAAEVAFVGGVVLADDDLVDDPVNSFRVFFCHDFVEPDLLGHWPSFCPRRSANSS